MKLEASLNLKQIINSANIAENLSESDLAKISEQVFHDYTIDRDSRHQWEINNAEALKLALQVVEDKTYPWIGASNVKFPLVSIAALQSHAREYPALLSGTELVKCRVIGDDPTGKKTARAKRISAHMSYQILEEDSDWEDQMDRVMITKPIVGTAFKKIYFDPVLGHNVSESVLAQDLVIPYKAKSLAKASRITQIIELSKNDIYERVLRKIYLDVDFELSRTPREQSQLQLVSDLIQGRHDTAGDDDAPIITLEQHRYLDLDGDGYSEPYIVTVEQESKKVLRIVARFFDDDIQYKNKKVLHITAQQFFVKYGMIPSPDGGIYDLGFGLLLGPLNRTANTLINQLIDAGTLSNMGGGFLGRGAKLRRGQNQFKPGEWKNTDSNDLRGHIIPLPVKEPSEILFKLLGFLVSYGERVSGSTDIMSGQNVGQNTPASTAQELVKQGSVIFNSIFKRTYRSLRDEFRILYRLNQLYLQYQSSFENLSTGDSIMIMQDDYLGSDTDVRPASDPNIASVEKRMQQATFLKQSSMNGPGYGWKEKVAIERRLLVAGEIPYISEIFDENAPPPSDPKMAMEQAQMQFEQMQFKVNMQYKMMELMQQADKTKAEVVELEARAEMERAKAQGESAGKIIAMLDMQIAAQKSKHDSMLGSVRLVREIMDSMSQHQQGMQQPAQGDSSGGLQAPSDTGGMGAMAAQSGDQGGQAVPPMGGGGDQGGLG